jgi:poly-gamma-glutamate synthesis protein (capsule biosynthesis protein)
MWKAPIPALIILLILVGCGSEVPTRFPTAPAVLLTRPPTPPVSENENQPTLPVVPTATATAIPSPVPIANPDFYLSAGPGVPAGIVEAVKELSSLDPQRFSWTDTTGAEDKSVTISINQGSPLSRWVYAAAVPFATVADEITLDEIVSGWQSGSNSYGRLILDQETVDAFSAVWGAPSSNVLIVPHTDIVGKVWADRPSWTLIPFDQLAPELKVLRVNGQSPLTREFNAFDYPLILEVGATGDAEGVSRLQEVWPGPGINRDPGKLTQVAMSGVTALGRATAYQMEIGGITTPGVVVGPVMQAADIAHVSHEVPFAADCPYPNPIGDPIFCARDGYLSLIESIGTDVIELTGNHVNDWGPENLLHSIDLYEQAGMKMFGGGRNIAQASEPALFDHNGNKIAFVGCNPVGPAYAWANESGAGSQPCDYGSFFSQITELKNQGYLVIATLQYSEFYQYPATPQQQADFKALVDAGASAVSGSQGHHAQGFDFHNGSFIHYGLGNFFFDQMDMLGTRQSFIDTYFIYDGRMLSVELFTSLIENYCCPRAMTEAERAQLLQSTFQASGW